MAIENQLLKSIVASFHHIQSAIGTACNFMGVVELAKPFTLSAIPTQNVTIHVHLINQVGSAVGYIHSLVWTACEAHRPWMPHVIPLSQILSVRSEDLYPLVFPVRDINEALVIDNDPVGYIKLSRTCALSAPTLDELAILVELLHSIVHVSIGDVDLPL